MVELVKEYVNQGAWQVFVDGSSHKKWGGAGIVLDNGHDLVLEQSLKFDFPTSNNQAKYEACVARFVTTKDLGAMIVLLSSDSQLLISQVNGEYQAREPILQVYLAKVRQLCESFEDIKFQHVPKAEKSQADVLSRLASTKSSNGYCSLI